MENKGFKITCLECGKETIFTQTKDRRWTKIVGDNDIIEIGGGYEDHIYIMCDCKNEVEST